MCLLTMMSGCEPTTSCHRAASLACLGRESKLIKKDISNVKKGLLNRVVRGSPRFCHIKSAFRNAQGCFSMSEVWDLRHTAERTTTDRREGRGGCSYDVLPCISQAPAAAAAAAAAAIAGCFPEVLKHPDRPDD